MVLEAVHATQSYTINNKEKKLTRFYKFSRAGETGARARRCDCRLRPLSAVGGRPRTDATVTAARK